MGAFLCYIMRPMTTNESIITDIQITLTHHDKTLTELSDVLNAQWREIENLKRQLNIANTKISELESNIGDGMDTSNVKPPHW